MSNKKIKIIDIVDIEEQDLRGKDEFDKLGLIQYLVTVEHESKTHELIFQHNGDGLFALYDDAKTCEIASDELHAISLVVDVRYAQKMKRWILITSTAWSFDNETLTYAQLINRASLFRYRKSISKLISKLNIELFEEKSEFGLHLFRDETNIIVGHVIPDSYD